MENFRNLKPASCAIKAIVSCVSLCLELFHAVVRFRLKAELASYNDIKRLLVGLRCSYCLLYHCRISFRNKELPYDLVLSLNIKLWVGSVNEWWITPETVLLMQHNPTPPRVLSSAMFTDFVTKDVPFPGPGSLGLMRHSGAAMLQRLCARLWDWLALCKWEVGFEQMVALRGVISSHPTAPHAGRWSRPLLRLRCICSTFATWNFQL